MEDRAGPSNQGDDQDEMRESTGENEEQPMTDSALCKHAAQKKEKYQDSTYSWIMRTLDVIFEYFQGEDRGKVVADLTKVMENFCLLDIEHNRSKELFEKFCRLHPVKSTPQGFDYASEFKTFLAKEGKVKREEVMSHPKCRKFLERVKELERGKELSQTNAISVE